MPMLHGCAFPGCSTFTLSTYCVEHELLVRAVKESERAHASDISLAADAALAADQALTAAPAGAALLATSRGLTISAKWHAVGWPVPRSFSSGSSSAQIACAFQH